MVAASDRIPATLKPTPGTWRVVRGEMKGGKVALFIESEIPNLDGAPVACLGNPMMPFVEANASLFVAAKDLLAACDGLLDVLDWLGANLPEETIIPLMAGVLIEDKKIAAIKAMKKANGGA